MTMSYGVKITLALLLAFLLILPTILHIRGGGTANAMQEGEPAAPTQPATGPGGSEATFPEVIATRVGDRPDGAWIFEPGSAPDSPATDPMPLVIFMHGFSAIDPNDYQAWIDHIVKRGAIVIYPDYQSFNPLDLDPRQFMANALAGIRGSLEVLGGPGHAPIDLDSVAVLGHSAGGILATNYAAIAAGEGLPVPGVLFAVEPGGCTGCQGGWDRISIPLEDLGQIPDTTRAIILVGEQDNIVGDLAARTIFSQLTSIPIEHRDYIVIRSDDHGEPNLKADHLMPLAGERLEPNALDWYGPWKLFDALSTCAFTGDLCDRALGNTEFQTFMGRWSDGTPITPAVVTKSPAPPS